MSSKKRRNVIVYSERFVVAVKQNGKILREYKDEVYLPFGSEYSILLKNLNSQRTLVDVEIDGREVITGLIVNSNSSVDLERFFEDNKESGHRFKFIEKTDEIREYRGDKIDDGIIKIVYRFEEITYNWCYNNRTIWNDGYFPRWDDNYKIVSGTVDWKSNLNVNDQPLTYNNTNENNDVLYGSVCSVNNIGIPMAGFPENDDGITVEGSKSNQKFQETYFGNLGEEHVICLKLVGLTKSNQEKIKKPVYVKTNIICKYCGKKYSSKFKYCSNCGAALIVT